MAYYSKRCVEVPFASGYWVTRKGQVFSVRSGKFLKPKDNGRGYKTLDLTVDGKVKRFYIHRIVLISFMGKNDDKEVNHKNGQKDDNRLVNLEWVTREENMNHAFGELDVHNGAKHYKTKITEEQFLEIIEKRKNGKTYTEIAKEYGYSKGHSISRITKGERWKHIKPQARKESLKK